jgi:lysozyme
MTIPYLHAKETKLMLQVKKDLDRHEAFRQYAYPDPLSKLAKQYKGKNWGFVPARDLLEEIGDMSEEDGAPWTYGFGFTEGANPDSTISRIQAERKLEEKILEMDKVLSSVFSWYEGASFVTKTILINMAFNLGLKSLLKFRNTLEYIKNKQYNQAARNMEHSLWYKQVGVRARELTKRMETQTIEPQHLAPEKIA